MWRRRVGHPFRVFSCVFLSASNEIKQKTRALRKNGNPGPKFAGFVPFLGSLNGSWLSPLSHVSAFPC